MLKNGFTTGTCAQAATKAACLMLANKKIVKKVSVETPSGKKLVLDICDQQITKDYAKCAVIKDSGDDPDVTNGAKIYSAVRMSDDKGITVKAGQGVGKVTKPGLAVAVGEYAINPKPREMIIKEASLYLPGDRGLEVTISVPKGKQLANKTFNPRLGIIGGISIIGTTGIVIPKSLAAYKACLALQLDVLKASGHKMAVLVLGYVGEKFAKEILKVKEDLIIKIGDHVGFMLKLCAKNKIKDILLIGHIGKLVKVASGQFNTHSKFGDNRINTIVNFAKSSGASEEVIKQLLKQATAEATIDIIRKNNLNCLFNNIAKKALANINKFTDNKVRVTCGILSLEGALLASYPKGKI